MPIPTPFCCYHCASRSTYPSRGGRVQVLLSAASTSGSCHHGHVPCYCTPSRKTFVLPLFLNSQNDGINFPCWRRIRKLPFTKGRHLYDPSEQEHFLWQSWIASPWLPGAKSRSLQTLFYPRDWVKSSKLLSTPSASSPFRASFQLCFSRARLLPCCILNLTSHPP